MPPSLRAPSPERVRPRFVNYGAALAFTTVSLVARLLLSNVLNKGSAFLMFYPAVLASAWIGGFGGGLVSTALAVFIGVEFFMLPNHTLDGGLGSQGGVGLLVFVGVGLTFSILVESTQRARARTRELLLATQSVAQERAALYDAEKKSRQELEGVLARLDLLQELTAALSLAATPLQVAQALVQRVLSMAGADLCSCYALDARSQRLQLLASSSLLPNVTPKVARVDIAVVATAKIRELLLARAPIWIESREKYKELFGRSPTAIEGLERNAFIILPLDGPSGQLNGVLILNYAASRTFDSEFRQLVTAVARQAAQAVDRARLFDAEHRSRERVSRLAEVAEIVNAQLDRDATLNALGYWLVPRLADWCAIRVPDESTLVFGDATGVDAAAAIERVLIGGASELFPPEQPASLTVPLSAPVVRPSLENAPRGLTSLIVVPLTSRGKRIAVLAVGTTTDERLYDADDLRIFEQLASRAAVAAENASLFQEARAAVRYRDEFLSIASHELNTPLTPLRLQLESALRGADQERLRSKLALSVKQVDRISKLVGELLDVSRITSGKLHLREETVDLAELVQEVAESYQGEFLRAGCVMNLRVEGPAVGAWDRLRLSQVVANLLSNAVKYGAGQPVDVHLQTGPSAAKLVVSDRGIGIASKDHERIFERFERAASARNYGGFGLGLFIAKQIIEASGGTVRAEAREGGGTTFVVTLPRASASVAPEPKAIAPVA